MRYVEVAAAPELRSLVACYWRIEGPLCPHRVLPDGCIDVLIAGESFRAEIVGTMTRAIVTDSSTRGAVGVRFNPGEAARLFPEAARELTNGEAILSDVWGRAATPLEDALASALACDAELQLAADQIDALLLRCLEQRAGAVDRRIRAATTMLADGMSVREVAQAIGLSERQLARRFEARVGVTPKTFGRVMRLQHAVTALSAGETLSSAASRAGYADQAHFTRDARELAGVTPRTLRDELRSRSGDVSDSFKTHGPAAA
jgi:AraC-like DNA-binding protein